MKEAENPFLEWALYYAREKGWPVFPVKPGQKKPPLVEHGLLDASTDEAQIRAWWKKFPRANIGVRTGGWGFVLDQDPDGEDTYRRLVLEHGALRDTLQATTPRQGRHRYYRAPPNGIKIPTRAPARDDWKGIDVRGEGGYVLAHPSIVNGKRYEWDGMNGEDDPVNQPDAWLVEAIASPHPNGGTRDERGRFQLPDRIPHGSQHNVLMQYIGQLRAKWLGEEEIFTLAWEANRKRCEKPGPEKDIRQYVRSAFKWAPGPAHQPAPAKEPAPEPEREHAITSYHADCPEPKPIIEPILYPGLTILGGRPKMGKSWLALQLGIAAVNGLKLAGYLQVPEKRRVLYVSLEDRRPQLKKRLHHLVPEDSYLAGLDLQYELAPLMEEGGAQLDRTLASDPVDILIVDSLLAAVQQSNRKNQDLMQADYNIVRGLRELASKHAIAILLIAHTRKAAGDFVDVIQGTSGTTAAADAVWVLQRTPEGHATLSVTGREVATNTFALQRAQDSPAWIITGEGDEVTQSDARQDILQLLRDTGPMKPSRIAGRLRKSISGVHRLLVALCDLGLVIKTGYGTYQLPRDTNPREDRGE